MPKASPSSSTIYQVTSSETIFLFGHILCILLGASCIFIFSLFAFLFCNKLGWTPAFFYGRETRSAFSLEYSCASLIFVEYSCLDIFSASSSCFACISCSELLAFVVRWFFYVCLLGNRNAIVVVGIVEKIA